MGTPIFRSPATRESYHELPTLFNLDEGFSEAFPSEDEHEQNVSADTIKEFQDWIMAQNEDHRSQIAYEILQTLRTSNIAAVVRRLTPRLHMDPVQRLPPEIVAEIFGYLDTTSLLNSVLASRAWRERILDPRLWKRHYNGESWGFNLDAVAAIENLKTFPSLRSKGKGRPLLRTITSNERSQPSPKRRALIGSTGEREVAVISDAVSWREQHEQLEADIEEIREGEDQEMEDAPLPQSEYTNSQKSRQRHESEIGEEMDVYSALRADSSTDKMAIDIVPELQLPSTSGVLLSDETGRPRLNWHFLYKQRRRLEDNWVKGRFTNFQLPQPQFASEAHTECVYTIQFSGKWLVSGSRDKSVRVWDLDTKRLRGSPLWGNTQSVLCLQFDPSEDEDVIISGSSDTGIIVWRFSTGEKLYEIPQAHNESVLNLRFDYRYLVTCSKDKVIKVWNRHELLPTDPAYPRKSSKTAAVFATHVIDVSQYTDRQLLEHINLRPVKPLRPYSHLMTLIGHEAAVNAIGIEGDHIVSASGDRHLKLWNVKDGSVVRTFIGHGKGIACVQYDSRRIVSGSSDNTVRIYDPVTGVQVAILHGHSNLVRTVQAGFGDAPGNEDELSSEARAAEYAYVEAVNNGSIPLYHQRRRGRNQMSTQNEDSEADIETPIDHTDYQPPTAPEGQRAPTFKSFAFGARLPPGGGGSKWGRIVSGSYDETIIIWRKDSQGQWVVSQRLRQEAALRAMNESTSSISVRGAVAAPRSAPLPQTSLPNAAPQTSHLAPGAQQARVQLNAHIQSVLQARQQFHTQAAPTAAAAAMPVLSTIRTTHQAPMSTANQSAHQQATTTTTSGPQPQSSQPSPLPPPTTVLPVPLVPHPNPQTQPQPQAGPSNRPPAGGTGNGNGNGNGNGGHSNSLSRIFKLQFDARRLICCSQDTRIVAWDFAAGDREIEEASEFFVGP